LIPEEWHKGLAACETIDVLARTPIQGQPHLLPASMPWRYLVATDLPMNAVGGEMLIVSHPNPPAELGLPALPSDVAVPPEAEHLTGPRATLEQVLPAMREASWIEFHVHGVVAPGIADAAFLALSPDDRGAFALTTSQVAANPLSRQPVVILGACHAGVGTDTFHDAGGLPLAFRRAGARAVVASRQPVPDAEAARVFAELRQRVQAGASLAGSLRDLRLRHPSSWISQLVLFE
jgi:hypothetical protein